MQSIGYKTTIDPEGKSIDPNAALRDIRDLHASGGPRDFERLLELIMGLDVWLQKGGFPPKEWNKAFALKEDLKSVKAGKHK